MRKIINFDILIPLKKGYNYTTKSFKYFNISKRALLKLYIFFLPFYLNVLNKITTIYN